MKTIKIGKLKTDERFLALRPINEMTVSKYRQAMRQGAIFPPLKVTKDNRIICGNHRYSAMMFEFGPEHEAKAEVCNLPDYTAELELFAADNVKHGLPLEGFSRRRVAIELAKRGRTPAEIAKIFNVAAVQVERWGDQTIIVRKGKKKETMPAKRGVPAGREITSAQYKDHVNKDRGVTVRHLARQITRWIAAGLIDDEDERERDALGELRESLTRAGY